MPNELKRKKQYEDYLRKQIERLNSEEETDWHSALENLVLAIPQSIPLLVEAVYHRRVNGERVSALANFISLSGMTAEAESLFR
jgi:hypothetical protein